jgi:hypothetical protein
METRIAQCNVIARAPFGARLLWHEFEPFGFGISTNQINAPTATGWSWTYRDLPDSTQFVWSRSPPSGRRRRAGPSPANQRARTRLLILNFELDWRLPSGNALLCLTWLDQCFIWGPVNRWPGPAIKQDEEAARHCLILSLMLRPCGQRLIIRREDITPPRPLCRCEMHLINHLTTILY